ncbi:hypothetical protein MNBD_GAMMA11-2406 [hydrothermal vent metagenome]|uniref:Solute-binding protein family 3/N-terminal domain-containing protein n=1 Tax=hydrothermal vent metagenome TaxID=652676 RepID=A0A3B0XA78_9ZZZZ
MRHIKLFISSFLLVLLLSTSIPGYAEIKIGVLAPRGKLKAIKRWQNFGIYMSEKLGDTVTIIPLPPVDVISTIKSGEVDFILTNPVHTAQIVKMHNGKTLATLNKSAGPFFAGVIISKKGSGIEQAEDLSGKSVMSLKFKTAAGAYTFQTYHLHVKGINPHKDFSSMRSGKKQDDLVLAVKAGVIDAAFIRSGILESMSRENKIKMDEFIIVDKQKSDKLKLAHSTRLYPEWYLTALENTDSEISDRTKKFVLALTPQHPAAISARINGFVEPISLNEIVVALTALKIKPFDQ